MAESNQTTSDSDRRRSGVSYAHEWNRFIAWSEAASRCSLPATPDDVAAYLQNRAEAGARASTIKVAAAAIAHNQRDAGFEVPLRHGVARTVLDELTQDDSPGPRQGAAHGPGLLSGNKEDGARAAQRKGWRDGTGVQRPKAGRAGRGYDWLDAGCQAAGERGG